MKCTNCGEELREGQKFCPKCGQKISNFCPICGYELQEGQNFCANCGSQVSREITTETVQTVEAQFDEKVSTYTESEFLARLNELAAKDIVTKSAIRYYGTKVMQKELLPLLKPGERLLAIANIYKIGIDKYAKEFFALTSDRALEIVKGGGLPGAILPVKVKECSLVEIENIETKKTLVGETLIIKTAANTFKSQLVGKGSSDYIKKMIEDQIRGGGN